MAATTAAADATGIAKNLPTAVLRELLILAP
jgi:hypothetical protein